MTTHLDPNQRYGWGTREITAVCDNGGQGLVVFRQESLPSLPLGTEDITRIMRCWNACAGIYDPAAAIAAALEALSFYANNKGNAHPNGVYMTPFLNGRPNPSFPKEDGGLIAAVALALLTPAGSLGPVGECGPVPGVTALPGIYDPAVDRRPMERMLADVRIPTPPLAERMAWERDINRGDEAENRREEAERFDEFTGPMPTALQPPPDSSSCRRGTERSVPAV